MLPLLNIGRRSDALYFTGRGRKKRLCHNPCRRSRGSDSIPPVPRAHALG